MNHAVMRKLNVSNITQKNRQKRTFYRAENVYVTLSTLMREVLQVDHFWKKLSKQATIKCICRKQDNILNILIVENCNCKSLT